MKWIEERDALIAQTKAFVEAVTRRSGDVGKSAATPLQAVAALRSSAPPAPAAPLPQTNEAISALMAPAPLAQKFDQASMSSEIRARVAAFRAHQERFNRERHEYFNATLARLRAEINELPVPARRQADSAGAGRRPDLMADQSLVPGAPPHRR